MLRVITENKLELSCTTPIVFRLLPRLEPQQQIQDLHYEVVGAERHEQVQDGAGNRLIRALMQKGLSSVTIRFEGIEGGCVDVSRVQVCSAGANANKGNVTTASGEGGGGTSGGDVSG